MTLSRHDTYKEAARLLQSGDAASAVGLTRALLDENPDDEVGLSMLGSALMKLDRMTEALAAFEDCSAAHPASFAAHGDLGFGHMIAGNKARAIAAFSKAVELNGNFYQGWCYLGRLQYETLSVSEARESFSRADASDPFAAESREIQDALIASRLAAAEKVARQILSRQRGHPKASFALAHLASSVGAFEEAADILSIAIEAFPCDLDLRSALINSLEETGAYARALDEAKIAASIDPESAKRWLTIGRIHGHCGQYEEALAAYDKALVRTAADDQEAIANLELLRGHILKILGRQDESVQAYRSSAASVCGNGAAWWGLADLKTHEFSDDDIEEIMRLAGDDSIKPAQRSQAMFALGKALEERRRYNDAFGWYAQANAMRPDADFNPDGLRHGVDELVSTFTADLLAQTAEPVPSGPRPIFIVGLPRSGSTLIEQILASHPEVEGTMELVNMPNLMRRVRIDGGKRKLSYPQSLATFAPAELSGYGRRYLDETAIYRSGKAYFIDKMPTNFDKLGLIRMILPSAILIDARRHPLGCGFSCFKQHFAGGHHFSYKLENVGHYYNQYLRLMDHWDRVMPGRVLCVRYEQLVDRTETVVRKLLEHCGLPFEDACLRFFENRRPVRTASSEQVRQPVYRHSMSHWKNFADHLQPLVDALGPATLARFSQD